MSSELAEYWKAFRETKSLNLHPEDIDWFHKNKPQTLNQPSLKTFRAFIDSDRFGARDLKLHLSLLPVPFVGNLAAADILIFLQNPGFAPAGYFLEEQDAFRESSLQNLQQAGEMEFPFFYLNPKFAWSEAFSWWEGKFKPVIEVLQRRGRTYREALQVISGRVATVELFPYHSSNSGALSTLGKWHSIPSARMARRFLDGVSTNPNVLKLMMRSHKLWCGKSTYSESEHFHHAPRTRGFTLNSEVDSDARIAGQRILERLAR